MKVLLIVPNYYQAIGIMAKGIVEACPNIDFFFFKGSDILNRFKDFELLTRNVDVIHWLANISHLDFDANNLICKLNQPSIGTIHHISPGENDKLLKASQCNVIQVESLEWQVKLSKSTDRPIVLAHQPVSIEKLQKINGKKTQNKPYRLGTFGYPAEFSGRKRLDVLLESLKLLKAKNINFKLVVQGHGWEKIIPFFLNEGIDVKNLGFKTPRNAMKAYRHIDLYVCSSDVEGGPLPVIESLASGVPVVSTTVGVSNELLEKGGGLLVEKNNPVQLAAALEKMLTDITFYKIHKEQTRDSISLLSKEKIREEYMFLYQFTIAEWEKNSEKSWSSQLNTKINPWLQRKIEIYLEKVTKFFIDRNSGYRVKEELSKLVSSFYVKVWGSK